MEIIELMLGQLNVLFAKDKLMHLVYGQIVYTILFIGTLLTANTRLTVILVPYILIHIVAIGKEIYDYFNKEKHTFDLMDYVATITLPTLTTIQILLLLELIK